MPTSARSTGGPAGSGSAGPPASIACTACTVTGAPIRSASRSAVCSETITCIGPSGHRPLTGSTWSQKPSRKTSRVRAPTTGEVPVGEVPASEVPARAETSRAGTTWKPGSDSEAVACARNAALAGWPAAEVRRVRSSGEADATAEATTARSADAVYIGPATAPAVASAASSSTVSDWARLARMRIVTSLVMPLVHLALRRRGPGAPRPPPRWRPAARWRRRRRPRPATGRAGQRCAGHRRQDAGEHADGHRYAVHTRPDRLDGGGTEALAAQCGQLGGALTAVDAADHEQPDGREAGAQQSGEQVQPQREGRALAGVPLQQSAAAGVGDDRHAGRS